MYIIGASFHHHVHHVTMQSKRSTVIYIPGHGSAGRFLSSEGLAPILDAARLRDSRAPIPWDVLSA